MPTLTVQTTRPEPQRVAGDRSALRPALRLGRVALPSINHGLTLLCWL